MKIGPRFFDPFALALLVTVGVACLLPCRGSAAVVVGHVTTAGIALLFFLHGAKLSGEALRAGATHWRLHAVIFLGTFALFPLLGLVLKPVFAPLVTPPLYLGVLFLCVLPSTVQSSIAFTSIAGGNVAAAICSASASNVFAVVLTPLLTALLVDAHGRHLDLSGSVESIVLQILVPFVLGQFARRWIGPWVAAHRRVTRFVDQGSVLLVVYGAFSEAIVAGLWSKVPPAALGWLVAADGVLLAIVLLATWHVSGWLGFSRADRVTITFCGSKKSLASGAPIASVLFSGGMAGFMVLPLMIFHQMQIMVCAFLAQRWARTAPSARE